MTKDDIQTWALIAFAIVLALALYKLYAMFNTPVTGPDTKTQHAQLENIIVDFLKDLEISDLDTKELFEILIKEDHFEDENYRNFNHNRLNQILQRLYYSYDANSLNELILNIHQSERDTSEKNDA